MKRQIPIGAIGLFYAIAVLCRYLAVKTSLFSFVENSYLQILLRGSGPALGAVVAAAVFRIPLRLSLKGSYRDLILPLSVFWILPVLLIGTVSYLQAGKFPLLLLSTVLCYGLLEEMGWRGFLQEQFKALPPFVAIVLIALLWFVWHLNFERTMSNLVFLAILFLGAWGIGKVYDRTHSLLAVAGFHSLNNFFRSGLHEQELLLILLLLIIWIGFMIWHKRRSASSPIFSPSFNKDENEIH